MSSPSDILLVNKLVRPSDWVNVEDHADAHHALRTKFGISGLLRTVSGLVAGRDDLFDYIACYHLIRASAYISMAITAAVCTSSRIGIHAVLHHGSTEMRQRYVADCLSGATSWSLCMNGPEAGSDLLGMEARAVRIAPNRWRLHAQKKWITGGWYANYFCVLVRTDDRTDGRATTSDLTMFVVPHHVVRVTRMACSGAIESGTAHVSFEDVEVSSDDIIGAMGDGFQIAMDLLVEERWINGVTSLAMGRRALDEILDWVHVRELHNVPLHRLQAVRMRLARMKMLLDPLDALALQLAMRLAECRNAKCMKISLASDCAGFKATATHVLTECVRHAMILLGGRAFELTGHGAVVARLNTEVHGIQCAGGTYDVLMDGVARTMIAKSAPMPSL
jgi:alkylation response protein AidB-like acyl-CoA dehydrogenase